MSVGPHVFTTAQGSKIPLDLIIMDCDGVIFDSNNIKTGAYHAAIAAIDGNDLADRFVHEIHLPDVSQPRRDKFERFFSEMSPQPEADSVSNVDKAFAAYSQAVEDAYASLTPVPAALRLAAQVRTIVVSGGDHQELQRVFHHHGITDNFVEIRGSGVGGAKKDQHVKEIIAAETSFDAKRILFVGDGLTDFRTAQEFGIHFAFVREMSDWERWEDQTKAAALGSMTILEKWSDLSSKVDTEK